MSHHRRSHPTVDADRLKSQAADVGSALHDASIRAGQTAGQFAHQAKDWAAPRLEKAWYEGKKAAAPRVERAAERALPLVDRTHDRLVDDILPKLVAAVGAAAAAAASGADRARDSASAKLTDMAHIEIPKPKKSHTGAKVFWSIAGLAVLGAVVAVFRRRRPTTDPWAEEPWESAEYDLKARAAEAKKELADVAENVAEAAGGAVAKTRQAGEKVAGVAREATRKVSPAKKATAATPAKTPARSARTSTSAPKTTAARKPRTPKPPAEGTAAPTA